MNSHEILDMIGQAKGAYIWDAQTFDERVKLHPRRMWLIAALVALLVLLVGCSIAYSQGWFLKFFSAKTDTPLTPEQIEYISGHEQVIAETQTKNGWTVELRSAIHDDSVVYILIGITAPEGTNLEPRVENDVLLDRFTPGNGALSGAVENAPDVVSAKKGIWIQSGTFRWEEDGDGLPHTKNFVIKISPDHERSTIAPFGPEAEYYIHMENIVREYDDEEYRQELLNGKYKGQRDIMFTHEETLRMQCCEVLAEGVWDFTVSFPEGTVEQLELLTNPVVTEATIWRKVGEEIWDYEYVEDQVTLTSAILQPLSLRLCYEDCNGGPSFASSMREHPRQVFAVMKDGSQIELFPYGAQGIDYVTLEPETPLVLGQVEYILLSDGVRLTVPEA